MSDVIKGPVVPWRIQVPTLTFNDAGTLIAAQVEVFYKQDITVDGVKLTNDLPVVSWDAPSTNSQTLTIVDANGNSVVVTRGAILGAVLTIADQERNAS